MVAVRHLLALAVVLPLLVVAAAPTQAEDEVDPVQVLLDEIIALTKADAFDELVDKLAEVPELYVVSANDSLRGKLRGAVGKVARDKDGGDARLAAIEALLEIEEPKGAWKELSKLMPKGKEDEASPVDLAVVKAAGTLAQSRSLKGLFDLAMKAKDPALAATAAVALGGFRQDKRNRVKVLEELVTVGLRTRPGRSTEKATSPLALARWAKVERGVIKGLNDLTGQNQGTFEDWEALWKDNKKRPATLFVEEEEE